MAKQELGVINEIGDLGLGFYPVNESEQEKIEKKEKEEKQK
jgi:hypothetical protein